TRYIPLIGYLPRASAPAQTAVRARFTAADVNLAPALAESRMDAGRGKRGAGDGKGEKRGRREWLGPNTPDAADARLIRFLGSLSRRREHLPKRPESTARGRLLWPRPGPLGRRPGGGGLGIGIKRGQLLGSVLFFLPSSVNRFENHQQFPTLRPGRGPSDALSHWKRRTRPRRDLKYDWVQGWGSLVSQHELVQPPPQIASEERKQGREDKKKVDVAARLAVGTPPSSDQDMAGVKASGFRMVPEEETERIKVLNICHTAERPTDQGVNAHLTRLETPFEQGPAGKRKAAGGGRMAGFWLTLWRREFRQSFMIESGVSKRRKEKRGLVAEVVETDGWGTGSGRGGVDDFEGGMKERESERGFTGVVEEDVRRQRRRGRGLGDGWSDGGDSST
ncbi:hypothetical protein L249_1226, partial [Ophiocordyceps polyrhachis-furcata BCC 54312]